MTGETFVCDIDDTICVPLKSAETSDVRYGMATPLKLRIRTLNQLALSGIRIILFTSRRMQTHSGDVEAVVADVGDITIKWLAENGVIWDELIFGKPLASLYIDDKAADAHFFLEE